MELPIKDFKLKNYPDGNITQWYGENPELYARWGLLYHNGIDIVAPHGTPMYAIEDGYIVEVKDTPDGYGRHVRLRSTKKYEDKHRCWVYGHCDSIVVREGSFVKAGTHIANMGNTGFVVSGSNPWWDYNPYAGTHLHLGMRYLIPDDKDGWKYRGDTIRYRVDNYKNGVKGAVDPRPVLAEIIHDRYDVPEENKKLYLQLLTIQSIINSIRNIIRSRR